MRADSDNSASGEIAASSGPASRQRHARGNRRKTALESRAREGNARVANTLQGSLVWADPASRSVLELVTRIAPSNVPVLISGESGTGKEAVARYLHEVSGRTGPFIAVNCGAMVESSRRGTPAASSHGGGIGSDCESWFAAARRGTLFLDEIDHLPLSEQAQLVSNLQALEPARTKGTEAPAARLASAAAPTLLESVAAGQFRLDLFYRLNIAQVSLLPLRERRGDIVPLALHFVRNYAKQLDVPPPMLGTDAVAAIIQHSWPGNVRELENAMRLALLLAPAGKLESTHLKLADTASRPAQGVSPSRANQPLDCTLSELLAQMFRTPGVRLLEQLEGQIVTEAFEFTRRNQVRTAALLGISRNVLRTFLKKHRLHEVRAYSSAGTSTEKSPTQANPLERQAGDDLPLG